MTEPFFYWLRACDSWMVSLAAAIMAPAGIYIFLSGLDDLAIDISWLWIRLRRQADAEPEEQTVESSIAIFVPLWNEASVIGPMLDHNLAAIHYSAYEVFVGVYPNDYETRRQLGALEARHARVHAALVPHDGPTSKADCLNWIYQRVLLWEEINDVRFDVVVIHDAEDLIHPEALKRINRYAARYDMVQVPVLALKSSWNELTHGIYCDEFAESQWKDLPTRIQMGGFLPGCGVGTAIRREALELLARAEANRIFQPEALTEDYDVGLRLFKLGRSQAILPLELQEGAPVATREYFPSQAVAASRQRTRWVTGNSLQCWQWHGWGGQLRKRWVQAWFFWRDRKGVWGNPLSLLCNVLLAWGGLSWTWFAFTGGARASYAQLLQSHWCQWLLSANLFLLAERIAVRGYATARLYGPAFALGVPLRMFWGNWINSWAALRAIWMWTRSRVTGVPLRWLKTEHAYPSRSALFEHKRKLDDVLVSDGWCTAEDVELAQAEMAPGMTLGDYMIGTGRLTEDELYDAISVQQSVPKTQIEPCSIPPRIARTFPASVAEEWSVLPFRVAGGALEVASPRVPDDEMQVAIQRYTNLTVSFHLVTPSHFAELKRRLL